MIKKLISTLLTVLLLAGFLYTGIRLETLMNSYRLHKDRSVFISHEVRKGRNVDIEGLKKQNPDVKGWIYLPDSEIDYPLVQAEDNSYYLHRGLDRNYLFEGSLFIEATNKEPFEDDNTVIYGHHMSSGSMFCGLDKYSDEDYFKKHRVIQLTTESGSYDLHVVAFCNEPSDSDLYKTEFIDTVDAGAAGTVQTKNDYIRLIRSKAIVLDEEGLSSDDCFVTLSTCAYNYKDARTQVICVIRPPEIIETRNIVVTDLPAFNKWLVLQVADGVIMAAVTLLAVRSAFSRKN